MTGYELLKKMELCDDKYVVHASEIKRKPVIKPYLTAAAAVILTVAAILPFALRFSGRVTASDVAALFAGDVTDGTPTRAYVTVCAPDISELGYDCLPLPDGGTVRVYTIDRSARVSKSAFVKFAGNAIGALCSGVGAEAPEYGIEKREWGDGGYTIDLADKTYKANGCFISASASDGIGYSAMISLSNCDLTFDGINVKPDMTLDDESLAASFQPLRRALRDRLGVDLPEIRVKRIYDAWGPLKAVYIEFCEKENADIAMNRVMISDEYIRISFRFNNGRVESTSINYCRAVKPSKHREEKMISLAEAEKLLYKGYVFGGHICELCMREQTAVDFEGYDKVGLYYYEGFPFYAFYKNTDLKNENGSQIYARTLVPAIKVEGLEKYFEKQVSEHGKFAQFEEIAE